MNIIYDLKHNSLLCPICHGFAGWTKGGSGLKCKHTDCGYSWDLSEEAGELTFEDINKLRPKEYVQGELF